jgi:hypothetical protein
MISRLSDQNGIALYFVDQAVLIINSSGPVSTQRMPEAPC